jgi:hypothetical protein
MSTLDLNKKVLTLKQVKQDLEMNELTVEKLNQFLKNGELSSGLYAEYMEKIGAKDQITDQRALDYFKSVNSLHFVTD